MSSNAESIAGLSNLIPVSVPLNTTEIKDTNQTKSKKTIIKNHDRYIKLWQEAEALFANGKLIKASKYLTQIVTHERIILKKGLLDESQISAAKKSAQKVYYQLCLQLLNAHDSRIEKFATPLKLTENETNNEEFIQERYYSLLNFARDWQHKEPNSKHIKQMNFEFPQEILAVKGENGWRFTGNPEVFAASIQGRRPHYEDRVLLNNHFAFTQGDNNYSAQIYAVFDGHSGVDAAVLLKARFSELLANALSLEPDTNDASIYNALTLACTEAHYIMGELKRPSGSTACIAFLFQGQAYIANVGDARAVMAFDDDCFQITQDALTTNFKMKKEIYERGGKVVRQRVQGTLQPAKTIGDIQIRGIDPRPQIIKIDPSVLKQPGNGYLIIASDGLWDGLENYQAAIIAADRNLKEDIAHRLCEYAYLSGSTDNISAIVIYLTEKNEPQQSAQPSSPSLIE